MTKFANVSLRAKHCLSAPSQDDYDQHRLRHRADICTYICVNNSERQGKLVLGNLELTYKEEKTL